MAELRVRGEDRVLAEEGLEYTRSYKSTTIVVDVNMKGAKELLTPGWALRVGDGEDDRGRRTRQRRRAGR